MAKAERACLNKLKNIVTTETVTRRIYYTQSLTCGCARFGRQLQHAGESLVRTQAEWASQADVRMRTPETRRTGTVRACSSVCGAPWTEGGGPCWRSGSAQKQTGRASDRSGRAWCATSAERGSRRNRNAPELHTNPTTPWPVRSSCSPVLPAVRTRVTSNT
jgi:hypothetical protein